MTGSSAAVGDNGRSALHDRLPVRIGHIGDQHIAGAHARHFLHVLDDSRVAGADTLADTAPRDQHIGALFQRETLYYARGAASGRACRI